MTIGIPVTKDTIDAAVGNTARLVHLHLDAARELKRYTDANGGAGLEALGYTSGEAAVIISAVGDLDQLRTIYEGGASLAEAKDFRTFTGQVIGLPV